MDQMSELPRVWNDPAERVVFLFKSIQKIYRDQLYQKSRQHGFTGPQIGLIIGLHKNPFSTLNDMSEWLGLSKSTVSGIVDRLVKQGVVIREVPEGNRRIVQLSLSPEFQNNNVIKDFMNEFITNIFKDVRKEDLEKITIGLELLLTLVEKNQKDFRPIWNSML
ncbi:MarR family transcriptional regulator [Desulfosporosinus sp. Sb-LF]|uniref:MarR family winged helix-turn-helix transcriptional regulator n=1 Tax=Desulfosporosinus sp. Sb-LF TaxID=2560027 RepID=UPI00107F08CB|nr:MarR family transcriptional regulator [Desulfosporosinus sp. Sb-LF]TGE32689.1 MarR family transcriptional regulator [Desulfosporosinus sp. Sb-LF]